MKHYLLHTQTQGLFDVYEYTAYCYITIVTLLANMSAWQCILFNMQISVHNSRNTHRMLYLYLCLLHNTACAVCIPILFTWEFQICFVLITLCWVMLANMVHGHFSYIKTARVAGYNNSAQLTGDSHNTYGMLYLGSLKALLHSTTWLTRSMLWPLALNPGLWGTKPAPWPQCQSLSLVLGTSALPLQ